MDSFLSDEESPERPERKDQPPPRRFKRGSRLSHGNRSSVASLPQTTQNQRRESFFSEDENDSGQPETVVQAIAKNAAQLSQAEKLSYLSSEESDGDSVQIADTTDSAQNQAMRLPAAAEEATKNKPVRFISRRQKQDPSKTVADEDSKLVNGSTPLMAGRSGDYDTIVAQETASNQVSIGKISDFHTSGRTTQDSEGFVRNETDGSHTALDHNMDDLVKRVQQSPSTDFAKAIAFKAGRSDSDCADSPAASPLLKPDNSELESLHEKFEEFAAEQRRLSDTLCKALESERHNQVEELRKYIEVVGDLTRMLEEERETCEIEARSHEARLEERFRQQEESWQSEIASLQAEIRQLQEVYTPPITSAWIASKTILDGLELTSTSPAADNASGSTRMEASLPNTPQSRDHSRSVDTLLTATASPAASKMHNGSDATKSLIFSGDVSRIGSENADPDTPGRHVLHGRDWPAPQRKPGTLRTQPPSPTLADKLYDRGGAGNVSIWSRSLADELKEEDPAKSASAELLRKARAIGSSAPHLWLDQTTLPPPVRVPAASQTAMQARGNADGGERCLTPQRAFRSELPSSSASNAFGSYLVHSAETASANFVPSPSGRTASVSFAHRPR